MFRDNKHKNFNQFWMIIGTWFSAYFVTNFHGYTIRDPSKKIMMFGL